MNAPMKTIFLCEDTPDGIYTAIYDAWASRLGHDHVKLAINGEGNLELFAQYREVPADYEKAVKVARSVQMKISGEAYHMMYKAVMSDQPDKADAAYRFLIDGFKYGARIVNMLGNPAVARIFELNRKVSGEQHLFVEFIRFVELNNGILLGKIAPKSNVVPLVAPHFADRFSGENWMIYDENRRLAAVHESGRPWVLMDTKGTEWEALCEKTENEDVYVTLWKIFHRTIAIKERENPACQRNHMPLWYRKNMTEFL